MKTAQHTLILRSENRFGSKAPPAPIGEILRTIPLAVGYSIRMAIEGRSTANGRRPPWLKKMSDIRLVGYDGTGDTVLRFEAPTFRKTMPSLYKQRELFDLGTPDPDDTGFDLLGDVLSDVCAQNSDSERFDRTLLQKFTRFNKALNGTFQQAELLGRRYTAEQPAVLNEGIIRTAESLSSQTPEPERSRIVGTLDMIRASTQAFALKLDDGQEIRGAMIGGEIGDYKHFVTRRVLVHGKAVFRASGRFLRIDAEEMLAAADDDTFFSKTPTPSRRKFDVRQIVREQSHKRGLEAIMGKWPGDETDDEIEAALQELS